MSEPAPSIDEYGRTIIDHIEKTRPVWSGTTYRDRIKKHLNELDEAWNIGSETALREAAKEIRRLIDLAICEEFVSARKSLKFRLNSSGIEFWLVPTTKAAKFLRTDLPCFSANELIILIANPPDSKTFKLLLEAKTRLSGRIEKNND